MSWRVLLGLSLLTLGPLHPGQQAQGQTIEPPTPEQVAAAQQAPLFSSHGILRMTLEADFHAIRREDRSDEDSQQRPAVMRWESSSGATEIQDIQLQTRGNFRLSRRNCDFPPLRINVKKEPTKGTLFEGQDKLKLVVPCKLRQSYWEQYVVLEYLAYRALNVLTDLSFRVRPAVVTFEDSSGEDDPFTRFAFIIEDDDDLAIRNGNWKVDWPGGQLDPRMVDPHHAILVDVFQYMIGNTDWSGVQMHNIELIKEPWGLYVTVPYDFDFSGIVNARYAEPDPRVGIRSVTDRRFRGFCPDEVGRDRESYEEIFQLFRDKKEEIYGLFREQEGLEPRYLRDTEEFLDEFYQTLGDQRRIERWIFGDCRRIAGE